MKWGLCLSAGLTMAQLAIGAEVTGCDGGYRRQSVIRDFALGREWEVFSSCAHPEMPRIAVARAAVRAGSSSPSIGSEETGIGHEERRARLVSPGPVSSGLESRAPGVEAGDRVGLWLRSPVATVDLAGVALERGGAGAVIRVRVTPGGAVLRGTVRGIGSVELGQGGGFRGAGR